MGSDRAVADGEAGDVRNDRLRARFRGIYQDEVAFNGLLGMQITRWEPDGVVIEVPFRNDLSSHPSVFHGGVVATLIDTAAGGAVLAGHDFAHGSLMSTVNMAVSFLASAPDEGISAFAACERRGTSLNHVYVSVTSTASNRSLAEGLVTIKMAHRTRGSGS